MVPIHKFKPLKDTMSTPVAFVGEYPRDKIKRRWLKLRQMFRQWGEMEIFNASTEMVENYDSCFVGHPELQTYTA